ncbi:hypothetical protein Hanom_Chr00s017569g01757171 [Helianthus anomalus]
MWILSSLLTQSITTIFNVSVINISYWTGGGRENIFLSKKYVFFFKSDLFTLLPK